jgi:Rubrerythrin
LSWSYFSHSQALKVKVEDFLKGKASLTLDNLQTAYNSEANSNIMYLNFAEKAGDEGHEEVAVLFKTLAHAEKVHRDNHAQVIKAIGAIPEKTMIVPQVGFTEKTGARKPIAFRHGMNRDTSAAAFSSRILLLKTRLSFNCPKILYSTLNLILT